MHIPSQRHRWAIPLAVALSSFVTCVYAEGLEPTAGGDERRFPPSYITTEGHRDVTPEEWTDPRTCGQCHTYQYEGWNGSMHSNAFKDPVFQALWALAEKADPGMRNHCGGCHTPIGVSTKTIKLNPDEGLHGTFSAPEVAEHGVSCDVCHTIFHPGNNFPIERTYDEWKYSIYAHKGIQCQDCHMVPVEIANQVADTLTRPEDLGTSELEGFVGLGGAGASSATSTASSAATRC
jgi:hypothetical protein